MGFKDALKGIFLMPSVRPGGRVRCVTHNEQFSNTMDANFHETMNLGCKWEMVDTKASQLP